MQSLQRSHPAWVCAEELDTETVARLATLLNSYCIETEVRDSACATGLALEAAEIFQRLHYSYDEHYWDARNFPETIRTFAAQVIETLRQESNWINTHYVTGRETLHEFLRRHRATLT